MSDWASVLPGFDRTRHALSAVEVSVDNRNATAFAKVVASHWMDEAFWQVSGHYDYEFVKHERVWKIVSMKFTVEDETGSREVFVPAMDAARSKQLAANKVAIAERNKATVRQFLNLLEREEITALVELFAADGAQINPYTGGVFPFRCTRQSGALRVLESRPQ